jgi:probable addiction module antidote protein
MAQTQTRPWDPAEHLATEEDMVAYLNAALDDGDLSLIVAALGDIARAKRMTAVARETGLSRESLYRSLSADGNPEFGTVLKVVSALGLRLRAVGTLPTAGE